MRKPKKPRKPTTAPCEKSDSRQARHLFWVRNPKGSPWPRFQHLMIDPGSPLGPDSWVAATDGKVWYVGKVENLIQSFAITDVTTGKKSSWATAPWGLTTAGWPAGCGPSQVL